MWVNNLTDDDTPIDILRYVDPGIFLTVPVQPPLPGTVTLTNPRDFVLTPADRRMFGVTVSYSFR